MWDGDIKFLLNNRFRDSGLKKFRKDLTNLGVNVFQGETITKKKLIHDFKLKMQKLVNSGYIASTLQLRIFSINLKRKAQKEK